MSDISDAQLHEIVERVVRRTIGLQEQAAAADPALKPAEIEKSQSSSQSPAKIIAIGADHGGFELKEALKKDLAEMGYSVQDVGTTGKEAVDYPDFALEVAKLVAGGKAWRGVMIDGAGIGSCMAANKVPGVRASMAYDISTASNAREHNDANVLTLGAGLIGTNLAKQILKTWLTTEFGGGRHAGRVNKIMAIEKQYLK
jgi:ribose 5-phosphate isomerase B